MKKINTLTVICAAVIASTYIAANTSFAAVTSPAAATTSSTSTTSTTTTPTATTSTAPTATITETRFVQNFQNDELSVQFRYDDGKLMGLRFLNTGKYPVQVKLLNETYILGPNDYVVLNPPNTENLRIYHAPYLTPLSTVEFLLPNRFGKDELYGMPINIDNMTTK